MNIPRLLTAAVALVVAATALTACATAAPGTDAPVQARPAALADLPALVLHGPGAVDAGTSPEFSWAPVDGAALYRLAVVGADGPLWAWEGAQTSVRYGGYAAEPDAGAGALRLTTAAWWSVVALDDDGAILAASDLRAVSPDATEPAALGEIASDVDVAPQLDSACPLFSDAEAEEFLEGPLLAPGEGGIDADELGLYCSWERADDEFLTLDITVRPEASREKWDEAMDTMLEYSPDLPRGFEDLGDDSYLTEDWGGTRLEVIDGDLLVIVRSGWTGGAGPASMDIARLLLDRYAEAQS